MPHLKEIEIKIPTLMGKIDDFMGEPCPNCETTLVWQLMPCPDGLPGCCVAHYGWHCFKCNKYYGYYEEDDA